MTKYDENPFGGIFDFDNDGKESFAEQMLGFNIQREFFSENSDRTTLSEKCSNAIKRTFFPATYEREQWEKEWEDETDYTSTHSYYSWRDTCEDGSEYFLYPEDFETEEEYNEALQEAKYAWRDTCEQDLEFLVHPKDFETEEEYNKALQEVKYAWRDTCEDGSEYFLYPEDFETEEEYNKSLYEARYEESTLDSDEETYFSLAVLATKNPEIIEAVGNLRRQDYANTRLYDAHYILASRGVDCPAGKKRAQILTRCNFIIENSSSIIAANYLTYQGDFLYAQAIKDHFKVPVSLPSEDDCPEIDLDEILLNIAERNNTIAFNIWLWCIDTFLPYADYAYNAKEELTSGILNSFDLFPNKFPKLLVQHMDEHPEFIKHIYEENAKHTDCHDFLIYIALKLKLYTTAVTLFNIALNQITDCPKKIVKFVDSIISWCEDENTALCLKNCKTYIFPIVKNIDSEMVQEKIAKSEKKLDNAIRYF